MSTQVNIAEAKAKLSELVSRAEAGEDVVIARAGKPAVRLAVVQPQPKRKEPRKLGLWDHLDLDGDETPRTADGRRRLTAPAWEPAAG